MIIIIITFHHSQIDNNFMFQITCPILTVLTSTAHGWVGLLQKAVDPPRE